MIRLIDVCLALAGLVMLSPVFFVLVLLGVLDTGKPFFRQQRMGRYQRPFVLVKFRTMRPDTASVATHLVDSASVTPFGRCLRATKLDELPQVWNVLKGEMSLVGPRPCLPEQQELVSLRAQAGVFDVRPGITGLAQVNSIDMSDPVLLAATDKRMVDSFSVLDYFRYIFMTVLGRGSGDRVRTNG